MFDELDRLLLGDAEEEEVFEELVRLRTAGVTEAACMAHAVELSGREGLSAAQRERLEQFVDGTLPETQEVEFDGRRYWTFLLHSHPPDAPQWLEVVHLREVGRSAQAICVQVEERLLADRAELADLAGGGAGACSSPAAPTERTGSPRSPIACARCSSGSPSSASAARAIASTSSTAT